MEFYNPNSILPRPSMTTAANPNTPPMQKMNVRTISKGGVATPFPYKLHIMLESMEAEAEQGDPTGKSIVSWQPHGMAFKVHKPAAFVGSVIPRFFNHTKYASFQRQLNLYGFIRITKLGPDKGAIYHPCFVRNQKQLVQKMVRRKIKGTKTRKAVSPEHQPNFYNNKERLRSFAPASNGHGYSMTNENPAGRHH